MSSDRNAAIVAKRVGALLRQIRKERGLSLEALAAEIDVSKLTLGQIERGEGNPTLSVIWKIASGLNIPLSTLLREEDHVRLSKAGQGMSLMNDDQTFRVEPVFHTGQGSQSQALEVYRAYVRPGAVYQSEAHQAGVVEMVTVMSGSIEIHVGEHIYRLERYDAIQFNADRPHAYGNRSTEEAVLHTVISYHDPVSTGPVLFKNKGL
jgi:XRE family transcriptional regulator, regulator of sulfur utilization